VARETTGPVLLEDESASIGLCFINRELKLRMNASDCVWVESRVEERAERIFQEYIGEPLADGVPPTDVFEWMLASLERIQKKLGGLETGKIHKLLEEAFLLSAEQGFRAAHHEEWISRLLTLYYDPMYHYGFDKHIQGVGRKIIFRGTIQECNSWLSSHKQ
jgi:tRNA 2-selenouridine synthase